MTYWPRWLWHTLKLWWFCDRHGLSCEPDGWDDNGRSRCERCGCPLIAIGGTVLDNFDGVGLDARYEE